MQTSGGGIRLRSPLDDSALDFKSRLEFLSRCFASDEGVPEC